MSTVTITSATHVSFLKKFGQEVVKILGFVGTKVEPAVVAAAPIAEGLFPQFSGVIAAGVGLFEKGVAIALQIEGSFAAVGQATNGTAKFSALLAALGPDLDAYIQSGLPGGAAILKAENYISAKSALLNAIVAFANSLDASTITPTPSPTAIAAAAAAQAAAKAAGVPLPPPDLTGDAGPVQPEPTK